MKIAKIFKKKSFWIFLAIIIIVLAFFYFSFQNKNGNGSVQTGFARTQNLQQTVLATGQVASVTDLALSFQASGTIRKVLVKEGDKVREGQTLAYLDQSSASASLTTAKGSLAQAQANYNKLIAGSTPQEIQILQDGLTSAKQDLANSYNSALNTLNSAYNSMYNALASVVNLQNTYFTLQDQTGASISFARDDINSNMASAKSYIDAAIASPTASNYDGTISKVIYSLNNVYNDLVLIRAKCDEGTYFSKIAIADKTTIDTQKTNIYTAVANVTSLQNNIASYKLSIQKAESSLAQKKAPPTQAEIDLAEAQILSAKGQVESAQAVLSNTIILAPSAGTVTEININPGEQATALQKAIVLQDIGNLHAEADVSEANIALLQIGQNIDYTFDALGPDGHYFGKILTINPSSTVVSGVVNYKVKGSLENIPGIKPGMTANMSILVSKKDNVLALTSTAIISKNNKKYVRVIDDPAKKTYHEVEVQTGLEADGGLVEIVSGLSDGQEVVTYIK